MYMRVDSRQAGIYSGERTRHCVLYVCCVFMRLVDGCLLVFARYIQWRAYSPVRVVCVLCVYAFGRLIASLVVVCWLVFVVCVVRVFVCMCVVFTAMHFSFPRAPVPYFDRGEGGGGVHRFMKRLYLQFSTLRMWCTPIECCVLCVVMCVLCRGCGVLVACVCVCMCVCLFVCVCLVVVGWCAVFVMRCFIDAYFSLRSVTIVSFTLLPAIPYMVGVLDVSITCVKHETPLI